VENILLTAVADVIDNADIVLGMVASSPEPANDATVTALRMMRDKLLDSFMPLGVKQLPIVPCESPFDENLHVCVALAHPDDPRTTGLAANVVTDIYKHGYTLHGRVIRRATVVTKGA
jgi:molecular chaperone GrpE (heat shock protein)